MRISFRSILLVWVILGGALGLIGFITYTKFQPEAFVALLEEQIKRNYPDATLSIGSTEYSPAVDLKLTLKNIEVSRPGEKIGSISEIEIRVPWWLLISDRGNTQINLNGLELFLNPSESGPVTAKESSSSPPAATNQISISVPEYVTKAKFTLRAKDIIIRDAADASKNLVLKKLLVKEFQYGNNSAFELNIPIQINHNKAKFTSELWLFGDLTPESGHWSLNFRGEFKTRDLADKADLEDLAINGKADFKPNDLSLDSVIKFQVEREDIGEGKVVIGNSDVSMDFKFTDFPLDYLGIFSEELQTKYLPALSGRSAGAIKFKRNLQTDDSAKLESRFSFNGEFKLSSEHSFPGQWQLGFSDSKWETSFITPKGDVSFFRRSIIDIPNGAVVQFVEEFGFTEIELAPAMLAQTTLQEFKAEEPEVYYSTKVSYKSCTSGENKVSGELFHGRTPHEAFYKLDLNGGGELKLNYRHKDKIEYLSLIAKNVMWSAGHNFLAPVVTAETGIVSGKVDGQWPEADPITGTWTGNISVKGLTGLKGDIAELLKNLWGQFSIDPLTTTDQTWSASLNKEVMNPLQFTLEGTELARITGSIIPYTKKSHLILSYPKNKKWKPVRKDLPDFAW